MDSEEQMSLKRKLDDESTRDSLDPITGGESSIDPIWNVERYSSPSELDRSPIINRKKIKTKKNVRFEDVTVYYFARSQSFVSVPSQGTITLGMSLSLSRGFFVLQWEHILLSLQEWYRNIPMWNSIRWLNSPDYVMLCINQYSANERYSHQHHHPVKSLKLRMSFLWWSSLLLSALESDSDEDEPLPVDDYYFIQPIATRQRRTLLKEAGLLKIDATEKHELALIRRSREVCGCSCTRETGGCQPLTCECYLNGIACQVDRLTFPCPCATMLCKNPLGRLEFNQNRVRTHFFQTITRLKAEKEQEEIGKILGIFRPFIIRSF